MAGIFGTRSLGQCFPLALSANHLFWSNNLLLSYPKMLANNGGEQLFENYESFTNEASLGLSNDVQISELAERRLLETLDESSHMFETLVSRLWEIGPNDTDMSIEGIKDYLKARAEESSNQRELTMERKMELKTRKSVADVKVRDLKKEIEKLNEDNCKIEEQIAKHDLPLLLRLMSSKEFNQPGERDQPNAASAMTTTSKAPTSDF